ncbi:MAG: hypothetical protein MJ236_05175 [Clostridia bacterium]|nr:hypothetical protein [Clostridia bacterium]
MDKIYSRVNWKNEPSTETPVNAENLNKMDSAIDTLDSRVVLLDSGKYVKPSGGIPKTDLASAVQTSLGKADSAVPNTLKVNGKTLSADITINSTEIPHGTSNVGAELDKIGNDATLSSSATGNPLKLSTTSAPLIDFTINGYTDTTDGMTSLGDHGFFDRELLQGYWKTNDGTFVSDTKGVCSNKRECKDGDVIRLECDSVSSLLQFVFYKEDGSYLSYLSKSSSDVYEITVPSNAKFYVFNIYKNATVTPQTVGNITILINGMYAVRVDESNSDNTQSQSVFIPTTSPLQDGDSISYHVDGSGVEHRNMGVVDLGSLDWHELGGNVFWNSLVDAKVSGSIIGLYCEKYSNVISASNNASILSSQDKSLIYKINTDSINGNKINIKDTSYSKASDFKTAMSGVMLVYEKAKPTDTPLTADQVSELKKLKTYTDETNISTDDLASMDVVHYANNDNASTVADIQKQVLVDKPSDYHVYSTEEKVVGEWVDHKTLYERTLNVNFTGNPPYSTEINVSYMNIDHYHLVNGEFKNSSRSFPFNYYAFQNEILERMVIVLKRDINTLLIQSSITGVIVSNVVFTIQYTKTTDTPSLASEPMMPSLEQEVDDGAVVNPEG